MDYVCPLGESQFSDPKLLCLTDERVKIIWGTPALAAKEIDSENEPEEYGAGAVQEIL